MNKRWIIAFVAVLTLLSVRPAEASVSVTFYDVLSPVGAWVEVDHYGTVWRPDAAVVGVDFYPYSTGGHWIESEYGWTWVSDWEWGWVPVHHGRWLFTAEYGWVWVPGDEWGPAWVEWRMGGGYVGWVPLGPPGVTVVVTHYRPRWCWVPLTVFPRHDFYRYRLGAERELQAYHAASAVPRGPDVQAVARTAGAIETRTLGRPRTLSRGEVRAEPRVVQPAPRARELERPRPPRIESRERIEPRASVAPPARERFEPRAPVAPAPAPRERFEPRAPIAPPPRERIEPRPSEPRRFEPGPVVPQPAPQQPAGPGQPLKRRRGR